MSNDLVHPNNEGFVERVTPITPGDDVFLFKCSCGNVHFRHAGYVKSMLPFMRAGNEKRVSVENMQVHVCTKCRNCYVWINEQMYDVTNQIDLKAWEKLEQEQHKATGPGGEC